MSKSKFALKIGFNLLLFVQLFQNVHTNYGPRAGIPLGIIYDESMPDETIELVNIAIYNMNSKLKYGRTQWSVQSSKINYDDTPILIETVCMHMSRGVLAIFGSANQASFEIIKSLTNKYNVPFISWSSFFQENKTANAKLESVELLLKKSASTIDLEKLGVEIIQQKSKRQVNFNPSKTDYEYAYEFDNKNSFNTGIEYLKNMKKETNLQLESKQLYLRPNFAPILIELIKFYQWPDVYFVYNHELGKENLEALIQYQLENQKYLITNIIEKIFVRKITNVQKCREMLRVINAGTSDHKRHQNITIIFDLDTHESYKHILNQIKDLGMTDNRYHLILTYPGINEIDLSELRYGGVTITGFSIIDYYSINTMKVVTDLIEKDRPLNEIKQVPYEAALLIDGLSYFITKIDAIIGPDFSRLFGMDGVRLYQNEIYINNNKGVRCTMGLNSSERWQLGGFILNQIKMEDTQEYEGITGPIAFNKIGNRKNVKIGIYNLELNSRLSKIGIYSSQLGLKITEKKVAAKSSQSSFSRKKKIVISVFDEPFFMERKSEDGKNFTGNDKYIGYCVDLTKKLSKMLNFDFIIRPVKDFKFGAQDAEGRWDGMVGELVRKEADMAVAPLTVSTQRERAIEFSMPFMNIGISIMISKPKKEKPGVFSFMTPLDKSVWVCTIFGYLGVSFIMYLVCRFSPFEWQPDNNGKLSNDFSFSNTLWFNLAALLQQGADFSPKSASARVVAGAWWFFTLILISSYTANLAAFLTVENMVNPIDSAEDLVKQTEIKFGVLEGGSTSAFFQNSKVKTYQEMWRFMNSWGPNVFVKSNYEGAQKVRNVSGKYAYLLESSVNEYLNERKPCNTIKVGNNLDSKGYGIATPIMSELSEPINLAILQLSEDGYLAELKSKWWYDRSECGGSASSGDSSKTPLNLVNVAGVFYILILGLILSVIIATLELVYKANIQSKRDNILLKNAIKSRIRLSISGFEDHVQELKGNHEPIGASRKSLSISRENNEPTVSNRNDFKITTDRELRERRSLLV